MEGEASNVKAMREALLKASDVLTEAVHHNLTEEYINECLALIHAALSAPVRNCDIGTVEEQSKRFVKFCESHPYKDGVGCRCNNCELDSENCEIAWTQMRRTK